MELGTKVQQQFHINSIARPHLERLMAETRESVNLAVQDGDNMVYLDQVQSDYSMLRLFTRPSARVPLYTTGVGKMFLSQMNESDLDEYLQRTRPNRYTPSILVERDKILDELALIRPRCKQFRDWPLYRTGGFNSHIGHYWPECKSPVRP